MVHCFVPVSHRIPTENFLYGHLSQSCSAQSRFYSSLFDLYLMRIRNMLQTASAAGTKYRTCRYASMERWRITGHHFCNFIVFAAFYHLPVNLVAIYSAHAENHTSVLLTNPIS